MAQEVTMEARGGTRPTGGRRHTSGTDLVLVYAAYAVILVLSFLGFVFWHTTSLLLIGVLVGEGDSFQLLQDLSSLAVGVGLFVLAITAEPYLRNGARHHELGRRFGRLALVLTALIVVEVLIQEVILRFG
jgi:hypothetical protein